MLTVQVSDVLAKVVRQQAEVVDLAEKRAEVLSCIEEFEAVRAECRWLTEYENDEMRYKVSTMTALHLACSHAKPVSRHTSQNEKPKLAVQACSKDDTIWFQAGPVMLVSTKQSSCMLAPVPTLHLASVMPNIIQTV